MKDFINSYKTELKEKAFELLEDAFNKCPAEILFINNNNTVINMPKYFYDFIDNGNPFQFNGYNVQIGYENQIIFFDKENGFLHNRIFKYKL